MIGTEWKVAVFRRKLYSKWYWRLLFYILQNGILAFYINLYASYSSPIIPTNAIELSTALSTPGFFGMWISFIFIGFLISYLPLDADLVDIALEEGAANYVKKVISNASSTKDWREINKALKIIKKGKNS